MINKHLTLVAYDEHDVLPTTHVYSNRSINLFDKQKYRNASNKKKSNKEKQQKDRLQESQKRFERVISALRFPLILGVVMIHSSINNTGNETPIYNILHKIFSNLLVAPCVPTFFFLSGFLFFYKTQGFNTNIYFHKLKKRAYSLLIPYIFWNALVLLYYFVGHSCFPQAINPENCNVLEYSFSDIILSFWDNPGGQPICYQFWYIRNLIVVCLVTPFLYIITKYLSVYSIFLYVLLYLITDIGIIHSALLFSLGSYLSICKVDVIKFIDRFKHYTLIGFLLILIIQLFIQNEYVNKIMILCGIVSFIAIANMCINFRSFNRMSHMFAKYSFFIYGFHGFPIVLLKTAILSKLLGNTDMMCILQYVLAPTLIIALSIILYHILCKKCPSILTIITGGRL